VVLADVGFIVRTEGVTEEGISHGESAGVPGVENVRGVRGEGSQGVDGGVSGEIHSETGGEVCVGGWFDGKGARGWIGTSGTGREGEEETGVVIMDIEGVEGGTCDCDVDVVGITERV
jgi:hypothetical protein